MKKTMKKIISAVLCVLLAFTAAVPAFAVRTTGSQIPVVLIAGDGDRLEDKDGNCLPRWSEVFGNLADKSKEEGGNTEIYKSVANVLLPFLIEGLLSGDYDNYYKNLQKEVSEMFGDLLLDENGEVSNGSGVAEERKNIMKNNLKYDSKSWKGYYGHGDYHFFYDWRIDPLETADQLHEYIEGVKKVTGAPKVAIIGRCLGTVITMAYIAKYGTDSVYGVGLDGTVSNGAELLSEPISGKFKLDGNAINRFLSDSITLNGIDAYSFANESINLLQKAGVFDTIAGITKETVYYVVIKGVTSALSLSTFCTWPSFWGVIKEEDFDNAMEYVFGEEGSEKRIKYAGLIEKINNYDSLVRKHIPELMNEINDNANLAIFSKYGLQIAPIIESRNTIGDQFVSVKCSSFGATTSDIYTTLSDEYIAQRVSEGKGKYISPDKQIDASTCMFPDQTWFIKGALHGCWTDIENAVLYNVVTENRQLTVDDLDCTQFVVYDYKTDSSSPMTAENANTYNWKANKEEDQPSSKASRLLVFLTAFFKWLKSLFEKLEIRF